MKRFGLRPDAISAIMGSTTDSVHINTVLKSAASVIMIRVAGASIAYILQILLAHWLGGFEYGIFAYAWVWVSMLSFLAPLGLNSAVVRFIPAYLSKQRWWRAKGIIHRSRSIVMAASLCFACVGALLIFLNRELIPNHYIYPLYVALSFLPLFALVDLHEGMARGFGWVNLAYIPSYIIRPAFFVITMSALFYVGVKLNGTVALAVAFLSFLLTVSVQTLLFRRRLPASIQQSRAVYHTSYWLRASLPFMLIGAFQIVLTNTDMIMLGGFVEPDEIAIYFASLRTANLVGFIAFAISAMAVPKFAALHANNAKEDLQALVTSVVKWIFWPSLLFSIFLFAFGHSVLGLFGPAFTIGYPVLVLLVIGHLIKAVTGPIDHLLNMTGNQNITAIVLACTSALNILLNAMLIPYLGLSGAATATILSILVTRIWLLLLVKRRLGLNAIIFSRRKRIPAVAAE